MNPARHVHIVVGMLIAALSAFLGPIYCLAFAVIGTAVLVSVYRTHWIFFIPFMIAVSWIQQFTPFGLSIGQNNLGMIVASATCCGIGLLIGALFFRPKVKKVVELL